MCGKFGTSAGKRLERMRQVLLMLIICYFFARSCRSKKKKEISCLWRRAIASATQEVEERERSESTAVRETIKRASKSAGRRLLSINVGRTSRRFRLFSTARGLVNFFFFKKEDRSAARSSRANEAAHANMAYVI